MRTRLNLDATFLTNFPAQPWLQKVEYAGGGALSGSGAITQFSGSPILYWHRLNYMSCGRWRRCIVIAPSLKPAYVDGNGVTNPGTKPILAVGLPGSNGYGDGAMDLIVNGGWTEIQFQWPLHISQNNNVFSVLIDGPEFGAWEYPGQSAVDSLVDDICGVEAAYYFLSEFPGFRYYDVQSPGLPTFVGGLSWGGVRAEFLISALRDCVLGYVAGGTMDGHYDDRPWLYPQDWKDSGKNYADMMKASKAKKVRIAFGGNGQDYLYTPFSTGNPADQTKQYQPPQNPDGTWPPTKTVANIDYILAGLTAFDAIKFSKQITPGIGHQIDLNDITSFFSNNIGLLINTLPEYLP